MTKPTSDVTDPAVRAALDVLSQAGWDVHLSTGYGVLDRGFLVMRYDGSGKRHSAWFVKEPWREDEKGSSSAGEAS